MPMFIDAHPMKPFTADALSLEAIHKHHAKAGISCDWVHEVNSTLE